MRSFILWLLVSRSCEGLFGFGGQSPPDTCHASGCVRMTSHACGEGVTKAVDCQRIVHGGICECAWGSKYDIPCSRRGSSCSETCQSEFPAGPDSAEEDWLVGTVWLWNKWRSVTLLKGGGFKAPTDECESGMCFWYAKGNRIYIMWGESGLHSVDISADKTALEGIRADGDKCEAVFQEKLVASLEDDDKDLYEVLGVPDDAEQTQIKKAYRKRSRDFHPDRFAGRPEEGKNAERQFNEIREAYEILGNVDKRIVYDAGGLEAIKN